MNILVSNFSTQWTNEKLSEIFKPYGEVLDAQVMIDGFTDRSRGFGYVEMPNDTEANNAIAALNQSELNGQQLVVAKAEPLEEKRGSYKVGNSVNPYRFKKN